MTLTFKGDIDHLTVISQPTMKQAVYCMIHAKISVLIQVTLFFSSLDNITENYFLFRVLTSSKFSFDP